MKVNPVKLGITSALLGLSLFSPVTARALSTLNISLSEHQSVNQSNVETQDKETLIAGRSRRRARRAARHQRRRLRRQGRDCRRFGGNFCQG